MDATRRRLVREIAELERRLYEDPQPLDDIYPTHCPVHGSALRDDVVPIVYGDLDLLLAEFREGPGRFFLYASTAVVGGRCSRPRSPRHARVKFCAECRAAKAQ